MKPNKRTIVSIRKGLVHAIADCTICGKHWEDYLTAQKHAAEHTRKTGHRVIVDLGYIVEYGKTTKRPT